MSDKINLDDYFKKDEISGIPCNSAEDNIIREKINQEMENVKRDAVFRFNKSKNFAQHVILRSHIRSN